MTSLWNAENRRKPKPELLLWPIKTDVDRAINQSDFEANTSIWSQARENAFDQGTIGWVSDFELIEWSRKRREFFNQSQRIKAKSK